MAPSRFPLLSIPSLRLSVLHSLFLFLSLSSLHSPYSLTSHRLLLCRPKNDCGEELGREERAGGEEGEGRLNRTTTIHPELPSPFLLLSFTVEYGRLL